MGKLLSCPACGTKMMQLMPGGLCVYCVRQGRKKVGFWKKLFGGGGSKPEKPGKRTYSVPGIPDLIPSDIKMGWPHRTTPDGTAHFGIEIPTGAYVLLTAPTEESAREHIKALQEYLRTHTVSGNQRSIDKMLEVVGGGIDTEEDTNAAEPTTSSKRCSKHPDKAALKVQCNNCHRENLCKDCLREITEHGAVFFYCADCRPHGDRPSARTIERFRWK